MKILGNRILVSRLEEPKKEGFATVEVQDSFVYKGKVEQIGEVIGGDGVTLTSNVPFKQAFNVGDTVIFAKYSPDTQEIEHEGQKMKVVKIEDIIAIL